MSEQHLVLYNSAATLALTDPALSIQDCAALFLSEGILS